MEFERDTIISYETVAEVTLCQEETLESIVPDACPDILRSSPRRHRGERTTTIPMKTPPLPVEFAVDGCTILCGVGRSVQKKLCAGRIRGQTRNFFGQSIANFSESVYTGSTI